MRIVLNPSFEVFSGKLGEIQYSDTKYGPVAGKAAKSSGPATPARTKARQALGRSSTFFGQLDLQQVQSWRDYCKNLRWLDKKSGSKYAPDPIQAYNALADRWLAANDGLGTPPALPPTTGYAGEGIAFTAVASSSGGSSVTFTGSGPLADKETVVEFWLQKLAKVTRLPSKSGYRVVAYATLDEKHQFAASVAPGPYAAQYRFVNKATGQATELVTIPVTGLALALEQGGAEDETVRQAA